MPITHTEVTPDSITPAPQATPRLHFVDGLRGLAMLMVLTYHCWLFGGMWHVNLSLGRHQVNLLSFLGFGHIGVNLFLVLSGFCLYWPLVKADGQREPGLWGFAKKRCRRILPPYYATLLIFGGLAFFCPVDGTHYTARYLSVWFLLHASMLHNLRPGYIQTVDGSLWSLALEFQLYILFPLLVIAYRRFDRRAVLAAVFLLSSLYRYSLVHSHVLISDLYAYTLAYSVFGRCFEFALGMFTAGLIAQWYRTGESPLRRADCVFAAFLLAVAILDGRHGHYSVFTDALWGVLFAAVLLRASRPQTRLHRIFSDRRLVTCGVFSYSVYLVHLPLVLACGRLTALGHFSNFGSMLFQSLLVVPAVLAVGYLFHLLFEKPFLGAPKPKRTPRLSPALVPPIGAARLDQQI